MLGYEPITPMAETSKSLIRTLELPNIPAGPEGNLCFGEVQKHIPFDIRRFYLIYGIHHGDIVRGRHSHKALNQVLFCVHGQVELVLDNGFKRESILLNKPNVGVLIGHGMWREMRKMSPETVIMTLADREYDESDYIRSYDEFLKNARGN